MLVGHDNVYPIKIEPFLRDRLFTWSENHGVGYDQSVAMGSLMTHIIDGAPHFIGFSDISSQRIVYSFWFFALLASSLFCGYILEKKTFINNPYFKYIFSFLYTFNFYTLQGWWIGERTKFSIMVVLPMFFVVLIYLFENKKRVLLLALLSALTLFLFNGGGWRGLPLYGGLFLVLFVTLFYQLLFAVIKKQLWAIKRFILFILLFFPILLSLDAYMTMPFISQTLQNYKTEINRIGGPANVFGWLDMISRDASFTNLLRLQGIPEWYTNYDHPYARLFVERSSLVLVSYIFIVVILLGFLLVKKPKEKKMFYLFVGIFIVSIIFTAGSHEPFGYLYKILITSVPGFAIFRSPIYKFGYAYWFAASFLFAFALTYIWGKLRIINSLKRIILYALTLIVCLALLLYQFPFITGNLFSWSKGRLSTRVTIPQYIFDVADWANKRNTNSRILLLPEANSNWTADIYKWGFYSLYPLMADLSREPFLYNHDSLKGNERLLIDELYRAINDERWELVDSFSSMLGIEYFIVRDDYFYDLDWAQTKNPAIYTEKLLRSNRYLKVKDIGKWHIYKQKNYIEKLPIMTSSSVISYRGQLYNNQDRTFVEMIKFRDKINNLSKNDSLYVKQLDISDSIKPLVRDELHIIDCVNCFALRDQTNIFFPEMKILPNSVFYELVNNSRSNNISADPVQKLSDLLGLSLIRVSEIDSLIRSGVHRTNKLTVVETSLDKLKLEIADIRTHLNTLATTDEKRIMYYYLTDKYLMEEHRKLAFIVYQENARALEDDLRSAIHQIRILRSELEDTINKFNLSENDYFYPNIIGKYELYLYTSNKQLPQYKTLKSDMSEVNYEILSENITAIGATNLMQDSAIIAQRVNDNKVNQYEIETLYEEFVSQSTCFGKKLDNVKKDDIYNINVIYSNPDVDRLLLNVFPYDEFFQKYKFTKPIAHQLLAINANFTDSRNLSFKAEQDYDRVFVGLCAPKVTQEQIDDYIKSLDISKISNLYLVAKRDGESGHEDVVKSNYKKINQTKYIVDIKKAETPFILSFWERYNKDWKAYIVDKNFDFNTGSEDIILEPTFFETWFRKSVPEDKHIQIDDYMNGWYLDKKGDYSIIIEYRPQIMFYEGAIISTIALFASLGLAVYLFKKNK